MNPTHAQRVIDLDAAPETETLVVVRYRGVIMPLTRPRILQLLASEEAMVSRLLATSSSLGPTESAAHELPPDLAQATAGLGGGPVSHASLSTRIRKIHSYSVGTRSVRPTHAGLLSEVLGAFDWQIPLHPNTHLEAHLTEIRTWRGVDPKLRDAIDRFLVAYTAARKRRAE